MQNPERLSTSNNRFEDLRRSNQIYVDHTDLLYEAVRLKRPTFLSRPRRFGKSLLISTLESLFSKGEEFFHGLKIEKLWEEYEKGRTYKVIHLDFSALTYSDKNEFDFRLSERLKDIILTQQIKVREILPSDGDIRKRYSDIF